MFGALAEVLSGPVKASSDYEQKNEPLWRRAA
jgi:hypothetical protein